jgi:SAM-dependent methyltransferase
VHDEHLRNSDDPKVRALAGDLATMDGDAFRRIFELAVESFGRLTGQPPLAYRAGGYRIADDHFPVLDEFGIRIDSSVQPFFHARVSDWMRTRTQPYWIDSLLEVPPTWTLVWDQRTAPETRAFAPNRTAGDPVSRMPASSAGVPRVAMYVSHSCELMRVDRNPTPEAVADYERRVRARVRPEVADRVVQEVQANPRLIDGILDEELVFRVAGLLRRIADRDDARCVTLSELGEIADRFPRDRRLEPVDPVPAIDRPGGAARVTGTRIYSRELLVHLSSAADGTIPARLGDDPVSALVNADVSWEGSEIAVLGDEPSGISGWLERRAVARVERFDEPSPAASAAFDVVVWPAGFEQCPPDALRGRLEAATAMMRPDGALVMRVGTLGVPPTSGRNGQPPLAELLFPADVVGSAPVTPWDAATFSAWLTAQGFQVATERRVRRNGIELAALERFADKLGALTGEELGTGAVDYTLRRAVDEPKVTQEREADTDPTPAAAQAGPADRDADLLKRFDAVDPGNALLVVSSEGKLGADQIDAEDVTIATASPEDLGAGRLEEQSADVVVCSALARVELERLEPACAALYRALRPGGQLLLHIGQEGAGLASPTTVLVGLLRAGLEVLVAESSRAGLDCRLLRPLELAEIAAFSGRPLPSA